MGGYKLLKFACAGMALWLSGCATSGGGSRLYLPDSSLIPTQQQKPSSMPQQSIGQAAAVDYLRIQQSLGLQRSFDQLGYAEAFYNTCDIGNGYSSSNDCKREYMVVIHFQLLCRDTEGTISRALSSEDMTPNSNREVKWTLKGKDGYTQTDASGYGQIRTVSSIAQKTERLKLAVGGDFLYMRAGEINRIVTPKPWCNYN